MRRAAYWGRGSIVAALMLMTSGGAWAADPTPEQKSGARAAATEGNRAFAEKRFVQALDLFKRAEGLMHAPTHVLMIARSHAELGQWVAARESYNALAREQLPANAPPAFKDAQEQAKKELAVLEPRIPIIEVKVSDPKAPDLTVFVNGAPMPAELIGIARPIDPGKHTFFAESPDFVAEEKTLQVAERAKVSVLLELKPRPGGPKPKAPPKPSAQVPADETSQALPVAGWVSLGVGVAGLGAGAALLGLGYAKRSEADDAYSACGLESCVQGSTGAQEVNALDDDATVKQEAGLGVLIAGGALAVTGATLLFVSLASSSTETASSTEKATLAPWVGPGFLGVRGSF